jgi:hypothetical protein
MISSSEARKAPPKGTTTRITPVTRSFFEFARLLGLGGHDEESRLSNGSDTCFLNIVWRDHAQVLAPILGLALSLGRACQM